MGVKSVILFTLSRFSSSYEGVCRWMAGRESDRMTGKASRVGREWKGEKGEE